MAPRFCEVALPVPLRTTFTYEVPESLAELVAPGTRVVVPFRNRALVGVVLELANRAPERTKVKPISEVLDPIPALPPKLLELGRWVADYYVAPIGEVFRGMLPPPVEMESERALWLTAAGREYFAELSARGNRSEAEVTEHALLHLIEVEDKPLRTSRLGKLPGGEAAAARLLRRGRLEARDLTRHRKPRMRTIVAWNPEAQGETPRADEERIRKVLTAERGPLPLPALLREAGAKRSAIDRLTRQGKLLMWQEPQAAEDDWFEADFTPPANVLNADQSRALGEIESWLAAGEFTVGLLYGVTGSGKTEVYLRAVRQALDRGRTALILVPEVALTLWLGRLCRAWFGSAGEGVAVLHGALPEAERSRECWRVRRGDWHGRV